ncbi:MAG: class I SAM-dependent DNA methyltransferase, partial [Bacteroidetes bacterium]|nr:class I SAM-dependent DNA methyltransferase [Bacteroidota bacterium]
MSLSWNEIRSRATQFIHKWRDESREEAEAKSFWDDFFDVFGQKRRALAAFEAPVKKADGNYGFIDLFWEGVLLVEHKSRGKSLDKAYDQSLSYFAGLKDSQLPRYVLVSDFEHFRLYDVEEQTNTDFAFGELLSHLHLFGFMAGYTRVKLRDEDPANLQAAELLGRLHDELEKQGYVDKELELFMVRLLFCLFADDTGIFPKDSFTYYIENYSQEDGRNLGSVINEVFNILDSPEGRRQKTVDQDLGQFPYVNGDLFSATLRPPIFERAGRQALLACCYFDWSKISPAIFGSLFQSVMNPRERRSLGAHYTSEKNILKVINSLFMDDLRAEFERVKNNARQVVSFHQKLAGLNFLDPACGCGNFLIMAYRELRMLEIEVIKARYKWVSQVRGGGRFNVQRTLDVADLSQLYVSQFYGIEIEEFAARIAEVAMWMVDHQMNLLLSETFGHYYRRLPLRHSPHIHHGDALALDWKKHIAPKALSYMMGNPPFVGSKLMEPKQREGLLAALPGVKGAGTLDFVSAWYAKAAQYIQGTDIRVALVSTNSITQGEQVGILWQYLLKMGVKIHFAHRTFKWTNEARGKAAVYCVIIGFGLQPA